MWGDGGPESHSRVPPALCLTTVWTSGLRCLPSPVYRREVWSYFYLLWAARLPYWGSCGKWLPLGGGEITVLTKGL